MSKPSYISIGYSSGSGDKNNNSVTCAANPTTGRNGRSGSFTVKTNSNSKSVVINVEQAGKDLFASTPQDNYNVGASGGTYSFDITTNAKSITISVPNNSPITITGLSYNGTQGTIASGGKSATITPSGDPGASAQYTLSVTATIGSTTDTSGRSSTLTIQGTPTSGSAQTLKTVTLSQSGASEYLKVKNSSDVYFTPDGAATTITFPASGGTDTIDIESNTNWTIV